MQVNFFFGTSHFRSHHVFVILSLSFNTFRFSLELCVLACTVSISSLAHLILAHTMYVLVDHFHFSLSICSSTLPLDIMLVYTTQWHFSSILSFHFNSHHHAQCVFVPVVVWQFVFTTVAETDKTTMYTYKADSIDELMFECLFGKLKIHKDHKSCMCIT